MFNRSKNVHITTKTPLLGMCCYVPFNLRSIECYDVKMRCGMGEGFSFKDFKVGTTFYISPNKLKYAFGLDGVKTENDFENSQGGAFITDKYKVVTKYERVQNMNPYSKKKYTLHVKFWVENVRLKRQFRLDEDACEFLYVDCL